MDPSRAPEHDRRRSKRPRNGDERPCELCGGIMLFHDAVIVGGGNAHDVPMWRCRCGTEILVREPAEESSDQPEVGVNPKPSAVKIAGLRELRRTLAEIRVAARAQRERAVTLRERARAA